MKASYDINSEKPPNLPNGFQRVSSFRRYFPQVLATTVKNFLLLDLGLSVAFPAIVIAALTGIQNDFNREEYLSLTPSQASWFGSIAYICQPIGSIISGYITDPLGRKRAMFIVNVPHLIAWFMMFNATSLWHIFSANVLLGLGVGLMEAPIITYVGEICEPEIRGVMTAISSISATLGLLIVFSLNTLMAWRTVGLVCLAVPIITMVAVCFVPETPLWLLSKDRTKEAEKALMWLRGWVSSATVSNELHALQRYSERSRSCNLCIKQNQKCSHPPPTFVEKLSELKRKRTVKPFFLIITLFILAQFTGTLAIRPYIVQVVQAYGSPISVDRAALILSLMGNIGNVIFICLVKFLGKRRIYLIGLAGTFLSALMLGGFGFANLPSGYSSFDKTMVSSTQSDTVSYFPLLVLISWTFFSNTGVVSLPWMLLSEVFPFKSRGIATGIAAAANYIFAFVSTKSYYNLEVSMSLPGVTLFYGFIGLLGFIFMYQILPETENRTLEDIELHFSDNSRKITDRKIAKSKPEINNVDKNAEGNGKPISMISNMVEFNGNAAMITIDRNDSELNKQNGCDNRGFTIDR